MLQFSIGFLSLAGAVLFPLLYLFRYGIDRFGSYLVRKDGPGDRVVWFLGIAAIIGFILGSLLQPQWEKISYCHDYYGQPYARCVGKEVLPFR